jgi:cell surface protein SprA
MNVLLPVPFLTRLVNRDLPNMDTDVPSNISFRGEIAFLKPDASADQFESRSNYLYGMILKVPCLILTCVLH